MVILTFLAAVFLGPLLFRRGKKNNNTFIRWTGLVIWIIGWSYLAWTAWNLMQVAG